VSARDLARFAAASRNGKIGAVDIVDEDGDAEQEQDAVHPAGTWRTVEGGVTHRGKARQCYTILARVSGIYLPSEQWCSMSGRFVSGYAFRHAGLSR